MTTKLALHLITILSIIAIYFTFNLYRKNQLSTRMLFLWMVLWVSMGIFSVFPGWLDYIRAIIEMKNRLAFLFVFSIVMLFVMSFYFSSKLDMAQNKIMKLTQELSLLRYELEQLQEQNDDTEGT